MGGQFLSSHVAKILVSYSHRSFKFQCIHYPVSSWCIWRDVRCIRSFAKDQSRRVSLSSGLTGMMLMLIAKVRFSVMSLFFESIRLVRTRRLTSVNQHVFFSILSAKLPNKLNFEFDFGMYLTVLLYVFYLPGLFFQYSHMMNQRRKHFSPQKSQ